MIKEIIRSGILIMLMAALSMSYADLVYAQLKCFGLEPTIVGTPDDDVIDGTPGPDVIFGLAGNDVIRGHGGDDIICAGLGDDFIEGGNGNDKLLFGGTGNDILRGNAGDDVLRGASGNDVLNGGLGIDVCQDLPLNWFYLDLNDFNIHRNCETPRCDFIPSKRRLGSFFDTQSDCSRLAKAYNCADFNLDGGICKVTGCDSCLCNATSYKDYFHDIVNNGSSCENVGERYNCFETRFEDYCTFILCAHEAHCGPFE